MRGGLHAPGQRRDDGAGHLVLNGEDILKLPVVALRPDVPVGLSVDQLHGDADSIARLAYAALENVVDPELARDLLHLHRLTLVNESRVARDHEQLAEARQ